MFLPHLLSHTNIVNMHFNKNACILIKIHLIKIHLIKMQFVEQFTKNYNIAWMTIVILSIKYTLQLLFFLLHSGIQGYDMSIDESGDAEANYTLVALQSGEMLPVGNFSRDGGSLVSIHIDLDCVNIILPQ